MRAAGAASRTGAAGDGQPGPADLHGLRRLVARPLRAALAALVAVVVLTTGASALVLLRLVPQGQRVSQTLGTLQDLHTAMVDQETGVRAWLTTGESTFLQPYVSGLATERRDAPRLDAAVRGDRERRALAEVTARRTAWHREWADPLLAAPSDPGDEAALRSAMRQGKADFDAYRQAEDVLRSQIERDRTRILAEVRLVSLVCALAGLLIAVAAVAGVHTAHRRLHARLVPPVQAVRARLSALRQGDLTPAAPVEADWEVGEIARDVEVLAESLRHERAAVASREADLIAARDVAERAGRARAAFLATMSHEIRTPLNAVLGLTDLILGADLDPEHRQHLELVASSGEELLALLNDVLDFSRIEAGDLRLASAPFDVVALVREVSTAYAAAAAARGLDLRVETPDQRVAVLGDAARLAQVLTHLVDNAVKFTVAGHVGVTVSARPAGAVVELRLEVHDTGIGIAADRVVALFEPFAQLDGSATRKYGGSGLGLAIARQVVEAMGGSLEVRSTPGAGSTFAAVLALPPCVEPFAEPRATRTLPASAGRLRVLVADDNPVNQQLIAAYLDRLGHSCELVGDGASAVAAVAAEPFDVVLMDGQMPVLDGLAATRELRGLAVPQPVVIAVSASAFDADREAFLAAGADAFLVKPLKLAGLAEVLPQVRRASAGDALRDWAWEGSGAYAAVLDPRTLDEMRVLGLEQMHELYAGFAANLRRDAARLGHLDGDELARALHKLKGSSGSFGARALAAACAHAEHEVGVAAAGEVVRPVLLAADAALDALDALVAALADAPRAPVAAQPDGW